MYKEIPGSYRRWNPLFITMVVLSLTGAFIIGISAIQSIRSNVRSTTVQVIREITNSKSQMLVAILKESERNLNNLAITLNAVEDDRMEADVLQRFENDLLRGLTIMDRQGQALYGTAEAYLLKGIPAGFARQVEADGFAMSDPLIGVDGDRLLLFGTVLNDEYTLYASLSADSIQRACGETTYLGEGYSYILGRDGQIIVPPIRYSYEQVYQNIRDLLVNKDNSFEKVKGFVETLDAGATGSVVFQVDGQEQLFCFAPLDGGKDWQFVTVVSLSAVEQDGMRIIRTSMVMAAVIIGVVVAALAAGVYFYWSMQRRRQENDRFLLSIYQAISENTDTVIYILNDKGPVPDYVFENSERVLGIPAETFLHKERQGQASEFRDRLQSLLEEPWPKERCQRELHAYNDCLLQDMWLKVLICPFRLSGDAKCIYAITDVTQEHNDQEKIEAAVVAAEQANAAKSSFFSNMSHEMRTPMNAITGMTAIAKRNVNDPERVLDCLSKIEISSRHLLGLINDVLDMSKIENGKLALVSEPFDLRELLKGLEAIIRPQCESKRQSLSFIIDISHPGLIGDTLRLNQIFMNLLSNAMKFTPDGGTISFTVREREQRADSTFFRFTVTDNGIGIEPEAQKYIFTPFERTDNMTVSQIEGTGLGLAITKNLISAMGGQIALESVPGQGSSFVVDLDLHTQEGGEAEQAVFEIMEWDEAAFTGRRILLAEDNAINQEIAVEMLSTYGAEVETAEDGKQTFEKFASSEPGYYDAILMDIQMPVMNGYEATRAIRACRHPQAKTIPIIAMTANVFAEDVLSAKNAGMDAHIGKPIELPRLYQVLMEKMEERSY